MLLPDKLILVGVISSAHGIKGEIVINSFTDPVTNICKLNLQIETGTKIRLKLLRQNSAHKLICKLSDITNRTDAEKLKGQRLFVLRSELPETDNEEFYIEDLRNLDVVNTDIEKIGVVKDVVNFGAGDIIEIKFNDASIEFFPFTLELFPVVTSEYIVLSRSSP